MANAERVRNVARIITDAYKKGNNVVVVLSAQGDTKIGRASCRERV